MRELKIYAVLAALLLALTGCGAFQSGPVPEGGAVLTPPPTFSENVPPAFPDNTPPDFEPNQPRTGIADDNPTAIGDLPSDDEAGEDDPFGAGGVVLVPTPESELEESGDQPGETNDEAEE